jgi:hypothetical protein
MLGLQMRCAQITAEDRDKLGELLSRLPEGLVPVLADALDRQGAMLGIPAGTLKSAPSTTGATTVGFGEVIGFDGGCVVVETRVPQGVMARSERAESQGSRLNLYAFGDQRAVEALGRIDAFLAEHLDLEFEDWHFRSRRLDELVQEGMEPTTQPSDADLVAAQVLVDRSTRSAAVAIKKSGGLLIGDVPKQLDDSDKDRASEIVDALQREGLVTSESLVICRATSSQVARLSDERAFEELTKHGVRCGCGREMADERIEEALTITERGRQLLDGSRWLSVLLTANLNELGVPVEQIFIEQNAGGDEMDCIAHVSGEIVFFELKDKEFSLGNAYSFGAKVGLIRPDRSVIVTSAHVGGDAKEHFEKARQSASRDNFAYLRASRETTEGEVLYIEGIDHLREELESLIAGIHASDVQRVLGRVLPLGAADALSVVDALTTRVREPERDPQPEPT